jgi:nitroimidazol reductase NimA-like FMN-containing flavoprotein (pyridoxamine 5'-phosphate oxidase superfamily)
MLEEIEELMSKNHFCILATVTRGGKPQSTGVIYCSKGLDLYVYTDEHSAKARNIRGNPSVAVTIPLWGPNLLWVPPKSIQFQGVAEILPGDDRVARGVYRFTILLMHVSAATFETNGCFVHVRPLKHINTYGVGVPRMTMARHPEEANRRTPIHSGPE